MLYLQECVIYSEEVYIQLGNRKGLVLLLFVFFFLDIIENLIPSILMNMELLFLKLVCSI